VPIRVADALMDRLAVPVAGEDLAGPFTRRTPARPSGPRFEPVNLAFTNSLDGWIIGGDSKAEVTGSHWDDYTVTAEDGAAILSAAVPHPYGSVFVRQAFLASGYLDTTLTLRAEIRAQDVADHAVLSLSIVCKTEQHSEHQDSQPTPGPTPGPVRLQRVRGLPRPTITGSQDWTSYEVTAPVPAHAHHVEFDLTLTGPGQVALRNVTLTRTN
jgi:hypothetical protein